MEIDLFEKRFIISDMFSIVPRRMVRAMLKGCDSQVAGSFKQAPKPDYVIANFITPQTKIWQGVQRTGAWVLSEEDLLEVSGLLAHNDERLTRLRGFLHGERTLDNWKRAMSLLEWWPEEQGLELGLDYVNGLAEQWPDYLRVSFSRWLTRALNGVVEPRLRVVRNIQLARLKRPYSSKLHNLVEQLPAKVTHLSLGRGGRDLKTKTLTLLLQHPALASLRELDTSQLGREPGDFLTKYLSRRKHSIRQLEVIHTDRNTILRDTRAQLVRSKSLPRLRTIQDGSYRSGHPSGFDTEWTICD